MLVTTRNTEHGKQKMDDDLFIALAVQDEETYDAQEPKGHEPKLSIWARLIRFIFGSK